MEKADITADFENFKTVSTYPDLFLQMHATSFWIILIYRNSVLTWNICTLHVRDRTQAEE